MKTAAKIPVMALLALGVLPVMGAQAQTYPAAAPGPVTSSAVQSVPSTYAVPEAQPAEKASRETDISDVGGAPGDVPDSVKDVVKSLSGSADKVSLQDLNAAREASAKLDVLLDIERKLSDLASVRKEREEKTGGGSMAGALPASALAPQMPVMPMPSSSAMVPQPMPMASGSPEVSKIVGAGGSFVAYVKEGDGANERALRVGDKLPDGRVVKAISQKGVTLASGKKTTTVKVKDAGTVFGPRTFD